MKTRQQKWAENNPEKVRLIKKRWNESHKENVRIHKKNYRNKHPEIVRQQRINWLNNNRERFNQWNRKYKSIEENKIKALVRSLTWQKYGKAEMCSLCNSINKVEHHHYIPYNIDNFIDLCKSCHQKIHKMEEEND